MHTRSYEVLTGVGVTLRVYEVVLQFILDSGHCMGGWVCVCVIVRRAEQVHTVQHTRPVSPLFIGNEVHVAALRLQNQ